MSVCSLPAAAISVTPLRRRVLERAGRRLDDRPLLELLGRRVGGVARAVVEPRVDEVAHVDDVDPVVTGECERVDRRLEEEVARVLAGSQVHERDVRGDSGHPDAVQRRGDRPGDVRAVTVLVHVRRVVAGAVRLAGARPVDQRDVDGEVAAQRRVEVGRDVRMGAVDARVEHADEHALVTRLDPVRAGGCGVDHRHVPLQAAERVGRRSGRRLRLLQPDAWPARRRLRSSPDRLLAHGGGVVADGLVPRDAGNGALAEQVGGERRAGRRRRRDADAPVLGDEESAGCAHGEPRRGERCAVLVEDDVTLGGCEPLRCGGSRRDDGCERPPCTPRRREAYAWFSFRRAPIGAAPSLRLRCRKSSPAALGERRKAARLDPVRPRP